MLFGDKTRSGVDDEGCCGVAVEDDEDAPVMLWVRPFSLCDDGIKSTALECSGGLDCDLL